MTTTISQFNRNIERVHNLHSIYKIIDNTTTELIDVSDVLRVELVLVVSAFDYYIHEIVRYGMLEVFQGKRSPTESFKKFNISLECLQGVITSPNPVNSKLIYL